MNVKSQHESDRECMRRLSTEEPADRDKIRGFLLTAMNPEGELDTYYRAYKWSIESDLREKLGAFDDDYALAEHNLKLVRRFLLRRYAFCQVMDVDVLLRSRGVGTWWLAKDYLLPRIGLSLIVGFGVTLGAGRLFDSLGQIAWYRPLLAGGLIVACLAIAVFLIYLNVRETLGGGNPSIVTRTLGIFAAATIWTAAELIGVYFVAAAMQFQSLKNWIFHPLHAAETGAVALVFAILTQFFFTRGGSMAEPL